MMRRTGLLGLMAISFGCGASPEVEAQDPGYVGLASAYAEPDAPPDGVMRQVTVTMYMTQWCPHCRRAQRWLTQGGYQFEMHDVDADARAADTLDAINPSGGVPTFDVEGVIVRGFDPRRLEAVIRRVARERM
jgi:glutaredoxin